MVLLDGHRVVLRERGREGGEGEGGSHIRKQEVYGVETYHT